MFTKGELIFHTLHQQVHLLPREQHQGDPLEIFFQHSFSALC